VTSGPIFATFDDRLTIFFQTRDDRNNPFIESLLVWRRRTMKQALCRTLAVLVLGAGLAGCIYQPAPPPGYVYAPPPPAYVYGPPVYGSVVIGGGWGGGYHHWH
jgi:hypothetical protein